MDLILWRHAEAQDGGADLARELTARGRDQAARVAEWLRRRLPARYELIASPAARAQQTAQALDAGFATQRSLAPGASVAALLAAARWPQQAHPVILVGHQPELGRAAAFLLGGREADWQVDKGAAWWLASQGAGAQVRAVASPELL